MSAVIEVENLCKSYGEIKAVNNISYAVAQGEIDVHGNELHRREDG